MVSKVTKQITVSLVTAFVLGVGGVGYSWASWTTKTLIAVDKRTEVMASQISYMKAEMERTYGNIEGANAATNIQASVKGAE